MGVGYLFKCNKKLGSSKEGSKAAAEDGVEVRPPAADDRLGEDEDEVLQINEVAEGNYVSQVWGCALRVHISVCGLCRCVFLGCDWLLHAGRWQLCCPDRDH